MSPPLISKAAARYTGAGGREHCSLCRHFSPRRGGRCARVLGDIAPRGWCRLFSREMRGLVADASSFNGNAGGPALSLDFLTPGTLDPRLTFSRASTGTYFDSAGVMRNAATNLWLQSADAGNAAWGKSAIGTGAAPTVTANQTAAPDGTTTAARVVYPAISAPPNGSVLAQQLTVTAAVYTFSVYLRGNAGGEQLYLFTTRDTSSYDRVRVTLTTSWQRFTLTTSTLSAAGWYFEIGADLRDTSQAAIAAQTVYTWGAQVEQGSAATPYIATTTTPMGAPRWDYDPATLALRGLLIEEARTNLWLQSANASLWNKGQITSGNPVTTANQTTAPDGTLTATRVAFPAVSGAGNASLLFQTVTVTAAVYSFSVYMRGNVGGEQIYLCGNVSSASFFSAARITLTTAWRRYTVVSPTLTPAGWTFIMGTDLRDGTQASTPASTVFIWGAQVEAGAFTTSYIPTTSAVVTRANDVCSMPTAAWFNASTGTLASEIIYSGQPTDSYANVSSLTGTDGNTDHITLLIAQTAAQAGGGIKTGGVALWSSAHNTPVTTGTVMRLSVAYRPASAASFAYSGIMGTMSGPGGTLPTITALRFMPYGVNYQLQLTGYMRRVQYWNRALSDAEMQSVTT